MKLRVWRIGGRLVTTAAAVEQFILALSGDAPASEADDAVLRRGRDANRALASMGF